MSLQKNLRIVHESLEKNGIEHALIGGLGLASLGIHRATFDVDFLVDGTKIEKFPGLNWSKVKELADLFNEWDVILKLKGSL